MTLAASSSEQLEEEEEERWKAVVGWEIYEVSSLGRVRRIDTVTDKNKRIAGRLLEPQKTSYGALRVRFSDRSARKVLVSVLVAEAFVPNPRPKTYTKVYYKNLDMEDCRASNLYWGSSAKS